MQSTPQFTIFRPDAHDRTTDLDAQRLPLMDITVVICTYNGAERIPDVLDALRTQTGLGGVEWEVLVIDNNSTDDTAEVVERIRETWDAGPPLTCVTETRQGLAYARQRAVDEAGGTLVAFLDDDNVPEPDWVSAAVSFAANTPGRAPSVAG